MIPAIPTKSPQNRRQKLSDATKEMMQSGINPIMELQRLKKILEDDDKLYRLEDLVKLYAPSKAPVSKIHQPQEHRLLETERKQDDVNVKNVVCSSPSGRNTSPCKLTQGNSLKRHHQKHGPLITTIGSNNIVDSDVPFKIRKAAIYRPSKVCRHTSTAYASTPINTTQQLSLTTVISPIEREKDSAINITNQGKHRDKNGKAGLSTSKSVCIQYECRSVNDNMVQPAATTIISNTASSPTADIRRSKRNKNKKSLRNSGNSIVCKRLFKSPDKEPVHNCSASTSYEKPWRYTTEPACNDEQNVLSNSLDECESNQISKDVILSSSSRRKLRQSTRKKTVATRNTDDVEKKKCSDRSAASKSKHTTNNDGDVSKSDKQTLKLDSTEIVKVRRSQRIPIPRKIDDCGYLIIPESSAKHYGLIPVPMEYAETYRSIPSKLVFAVPDPYYCPSQPRRRNMKSRLGR